jgi:hypothetical protein
MSGVSNRYNVNQLKKIGIIPNSLPEYMNDSYFIQYYFTHKPSPASRYRADFDTRLAILERRVDDLQTSNLQMSNAIDHIKPTSYTKLYQKVLKVKEPVIQDILYSDDEKFSD